jgi:hypothetical protein
MLHLLTYIYGQENPIPTFILFYFLGAGQKNSTCTKWKRSSGYENSTFGGIEI